MGLAVLTAPVSTVNAQLAPITLGVYVGGVFPTGDIGDVVNTGWLVGAHVAYRFSGGTSPVGLRLDLSYGSSSFKDLGGGSSTGSVDGKQNNFYGLAYAVLHPNIGQDTDKAQMDIWVGGGGGFVSSSFSGSDTEGNIPSGCSPLSSTCVEAFPGSTNGALSGIVGGAAPIGGIYLYFEGRWVLIFSEGTSQNLFPVVAGVRIPFGG
jgi:hypothetical protein